ncbi:hypothetical protein VPH35_084956 [Triticum aestivum]
MANPPSTPLLFASSHPTPPPVTSSSPTTGALSPPLPDRLDQIRPGSPSLLAPETLEAPIFPTQTPPHSADSPIPAGDLYSPSPLPLTFPPKGRPQTGRIHHAHSGASGSDARNQRRSAFRIPSALFHNSTHGGLLLHLHT